MAWRAIVQILARTRSGLVPPDVGNTSTEITSETQSAREELIWEPEDTDAESWRFAARDYAVACRELSRVLIPSDESGPDHPKRENGDSNHRRDQLADLSTPLRIIAFLTDHPYWTKKAIAKGAGISVGHVYRLCEANETLKKSWDGHPGPRGKKRTPRTGVTDGKGTVDSAVD